MKKGRKFNDISEKVLFLFYYNYMKPCDHGPNETFI